MCLWNTDALGGNKVKFGKICKSYILIPLHPQGLVMLVKCEKPIVWLLYQHPNFKYRTLFVSGMELQTDRPTGRQTIRLLDAPGRTFQAGGDKN